MKKRWLILLPFLLSFVVLLSGCEAQLTAAPTPSPTPVAQEEVPAYSGSPYVEVEGNQPAFLQEELTTTSSNLTARWILWDGVAWRLPAWERT